MKVLFLAGWFPKEKKYKGVFIKEHALAAAKFHTVAVIHGEEKKWQKERFLFSFSKEDNLQVLRFSYRKIPLIPSYRSYVKGMLLALEKLLSKGFKPDIVHACVYKTGIPAYMIKKRWGIPYVITEHYSGFPRKNLNRKKRKMAKTGMEGAEFILPVSNSLKEDIISYGIKGRFEVVPNVVSEHFYYVPQTRNNYGVKRVLCVTAMHPKKNCPVLIRACQLLNERRKDFRLTIIGDGIKMQEYRKMVEQLSLGEVIEFLGALPKNEIARIMQSSDFFVLPSKFETFGVVLIESLASGLPVVATKIGPIPEIINENNGILVNPDDPMELNEAMNYMLDNSRGYDRRSISMGARAKYSHETIGKLLDDIYNRIVTQNIKDCR